MCCLTRNSRQRRATMAPEQYAQEFECSLESALIGSYYGSYLETAPGRGPHHPRAVGAERARAYRRGISASATPRRSGFSSLWAACST